MEEKPKYYMSRLWVHQGSLLTDRDKRPIVEAAMDRIATTLGGERGVHTITVRSEESQVAAMMMLDGLIKDGLIKGYQYSTEWGDPEGRIEMTHGEVFREGG
jgi:hypothetical protein